MIPNLEDKIKIGAEDVFPDGAIVSISENGKDFKHWGEYISGFGFVRTEKKEDQFGLKWEEVRK